VLAQLALLFWVHAVFADHVGREFHELAQSIELFEGLEDEVQAEAVTLWSSVSDLHDELHYHF
jgi:hypothetical protein